MVEINSYEERMEEIIKELKIEYNKFLKTKRGQKWKADWIKRCCNSGDDIKDAGDFGYYLYDFYPEILM